MATNATATTTRRERRAFYINFKYNLLLSLPAKNNYSNNNSWSNSNSNTNVQRGHNNEQGPKSSEPVRVAFPALTVPQHTKWVREGARGKGRGYCELGTSQTAKQLSSNWICELFLDTECIHCSSSRAACEPHDHIRYTHTLYICYIYILYFMYSISYKKQLFLQLVSIQGYE